MSAETQSVPVAALLRLYVAWFYIGSTVVVAGFMFALVVPYSVFLAVAAAAWALSSLFLSPWTRTIRSGHIVFGEAAAGSLVIGAMLAFVTAYALIVVGRGT